MHDREHVLGDDSPVQLGGSSIQSSASGTRLKGSSVLRDGSSLRKVILQLRVEKVSVRDPSQSDGAGYAVLVVRGDHLALNESPVATDHPLPGSRTLLFEHRSCAALWSALTAWEDIADGRSIRMYKVRPIRYTGATCCYTLRVVDGPLCCDIVDVIEAKQFVIPPRGLERPKATALVYPHKGAPLPRRCR